MSETQNTQPRKFNSLQELFADPARWTKRRSAADAEGRWTDFYDPKAACWCLTGGINLVYGAGADYGLVSEKLTAARKKLFPDSRYSTLQWWNDAWERTHEDILALVTEAGV